MLTLDALKVQQGRFELSADMTLETGSVTAVIGPSGGGKTTLLSSIAGFTRPRSGRILWNQADLGKYTPGQRPVSMVFQDNNLFPHMTAFDNVAIGLKPSLRLTAAEKDQVFGALQRVGLDGMADRKPAKLSGGQQSRVALARVLARDRPLLLLDEPFAALGPALRAHMLDLVAELVSATRATLLMVTHDPADAIRISTQTIFVDGGVVRPPVATKEIFANPPQALTDYLGDLSGHHPQQTENAP
ncbi:MAG: thiamine ABC transporter ATP-binding protein [Paracoccaceae bacterium]